MEVSPLSYHQERLNDESFATGVNLAGVVIEDKHIFNIFIKRGDFTDTVFRNCKFEDVFFNNAKTTDTVFRNCEFEDVTFYNAKTAGMRFEECTFVNTFFRSDSDGLYIPSDVSGFPTVPFVPALEERIYQAIQNAESKGDKPALEMETWHTTYFDHEQNACGTAHCLAGWAIHLAGKEGYKLEEVFGAEEAGILIYRKSCGFVPDFFVISVDALRDLEKRLGITVPKDQK